MYHSLFIYYDAAIRAYEGAHAAPRAFAAREYCRFHALYVELTRYLYKAVRAVHDAKIATLALILVYFDLSHFFAITSLLCRP